MNWDDLRVFLAFSRGKSVTAAAKYLNVNYTTVGRRLKHLEEGLGTRLYDNRYGEMALTSAGVMLKEYAEAMEQQAHSIDRFLSGLDHSLAGPVVITAPNALSHFYILPALKDFMQQYPDINVSVINTPKMANMDAKEADIALRLTATPPDNLIGKPLFNIQHGLYAHKNADIDRLGLILFDSDETLPSWAAQHFNGKSVSLRVSERSAMLAATRIGLGIARLPCYMADKAPDLLRLPLKLTPSDFKLWLLSHPDLRGNVRTSSCRRFLQETFEKQTDLFTGKLSEYFP